MSAHSSENQERGTHSSQTQDRKSVLIIGPGILVTFSIRSGCWTAASVVGVGVGGDLNWHRSVLASILERIITAVYELVLTVNVEETPHSDHEFAFVWEIGKEQRTRVGEGDGE